MPRLSLYRPTKGNDYNFFDQRISEMFTVGGVDIHLHKYLGPIDQPFTSNTEPGTTGITAIQDLLFLENRDRKYDTSVYTMRTIFRINDNDFDLTQFGLFLTGDTMFAVFHFNDMIQTIGRKIMVGDVMELPILKDFYPLDDSIPVALKRYYVVQDATRAAEGFSPLWYPHLWRVKLSPMVDSQEYKDILNQLANPDDPNDTSTLNDVLSTYNKYIDINDAVVSRAESDVPESGYDTSHIFTLSTDGNTSVTPTEKVQGYLTGDGIPPNADNVTAGIAFPASPASGDYYLRLDYVPNRLFRYDGRRWVKIEDSVRTSLTPNPSNPTTTQLEGFINNTNKYMSNSIAYDGIRITSNVYTPSANAKTLSFNVSTGNIVVKLGYASTLGARTFINGLNIPNTVSNASGNLGIHITSSLYATGDLIEYTVYRHVINERQSLSQALRPSADNL